VSIERLPAWTGQQTQGENRVLSIALDPNDGMVRELDERTTTLNP
jgi:hypothetical protein